LKRKEKEGRASHDLRAGKQGKKGTQREGPKAFSKTLPRSATCQRYRKEKEEIEKQHNGGRMKREKKKGIPRLRHGRKGKGEPVGERVISFVAFGRKPDAAYR